MAAALSVTLAAHPSTAARGALSPAEGQAPVEFDVASLKPNNTGQPQVGLSPDPAISGEFRIVHIPLRNLILRGYPVSSLPIEIVNLPPWANDFYDFLAKSRPGTTAEQQQQMFRAFLTDRLKLTAHYESRQQQGYNLVFARSDHTLGAGLKPSELDCAQASGRPQPGRDRDLVAFASTHCGMSMTDLDGTMYSGGLTMASLVSTLAATVGRPVADRTGLTGYYSVKFRFLRFPLPTGREPQPEDPPSVFTALSEQLGLKLESETLASQILVIDHIERPTEN